MNKLFAHTITSLILLDYLKLQFHIYWKPFFTYFREKEGKWTNNDKIIKILKWILIRNQTLSPNWVSFSFQRGINFQSGGLLNQKAKQVLPHYSHNVGKKKKPACQAIHYYRCKYVEVNAPLTLKFILLEPSAFLHLGGSGRSWCM